MVVPGGHGRSEGGQRAGKQGGAPVAKRWLRAWWLYSLEPKQSKRARVEWLVVEIRRGRRERARDAKAEDEPSAPGVGLNTPSTQREASLSQIAS